MTQNTAYHIIMLGDADVGRADVLFQFVDGKISETGLAPGEETKTKYLTNPDGSKTKLVISDPAGQEQFRHVTSSFYRKADAVVLVYDITDQSSFNNCEHWLGEVKKYGKNSIVKALVGNRLDLVTSGTAKRGVELSTAKDWAKSHGIDTCMEVSAMDGTNVNDAFTELVKQLNAQKVTRDGGTTSGASSTQNYNTLVNLNEQTPPGKTTGRRTGFCSV